jgi:hypothetical protein
MNILGWWRNSSDSLVEQRLSLDFSNMGSASGLRI